MPHSINQLSSDARTLVGGLSGNKIVIPDANPTPMPSLAGTGVIHNGNPVEGFGIDGSQAYPDVRSFRRKLGLLIPATNTTMEHELWSVIVNNQTVLDGIGIHTANVLTPKPRFGTAAEVLEYKEQFVNGLRTAVDHILPAEPQYLIMGMSLEHILHGIGDIRSLITDVEAQSGLSWATWDRAASAALTKFGAMRIGLLTPFEETGNQNAAKMFEDLGFDVVSTVGFSCAHALHIAHIPDWAKEKAIAELLATAENRLDAIVQCGTNMSMIQVAERLEPRLGIPIIGINAATFWYAMRENGFSSPLNGAGMLLREY